jgi:hypothetical protein
MRAYKAAYPALVKDSRNLILGGCGDGVAPFDKATKNLSIMCYVFTVFNLPPHIRSKYDNLLVWGGYQGIHNKHQQVHKILTEDLKVVSKGIDVWDSFQGKPFRCITKVLAFTADTPGLGDLSGQKGVAAKSGCYKCRLVGVFCVCLDKHLYANKLQEAAGGSVEDLRTHATITKQSQDLSVSTHPASILARLRFLLPNMLTGNNYQVTHPRTRSIPRATNKHACKRLGSRFHATCCVGVGCTPPLITVPMEGRLLANGIKTACWFHVSQRLRAIGPQAKSIAETLATNTGTLGDIPFTGLGYIDRALSFMLDTMHVCGNICRDALNMFMGTKKFVGHLAKSLDEFGMHPHVVANIQTQPWSWSQTARKEVNLLMRATTFPTAWFGDHTNIGQVSDKGGLVGMKTHTYHVILLSGLLVELANWPKGTKE